jgi:hypothetical protein
LNRKTESVRSLGRDKQPQLAWEHFDFHRQGAAEVAIYLVRNASRSGWFQTKTARARQLSIG